MIAEKMNTASSTGAASEREPKEAASRGDTSEIIVIGTNYWATFMSDINGSQNKHCYSNVINVENIPEVLHRSCTMSFSRIKRFLGLENFLPAGVGSAIRGLSLLLPSG